MSTDNFGSLGADFFIKTYDKGSTMSQADLDALVQYVQLTTTILAIGDFTPNEQDSVWMILERVDVPSAPGYTVTNNTDVTMTSSGMVTIDSIPWSKITGKPTLFTANQTVNTGDSVSFNRLTVTGASGIEGGEIQLAKAPTSTLAGDVIIDVYENKLRFFEGGGNGRGFYLDLTTGANNTNTNIMSGGDSFSGSYNDLTDKPTIPTSFSSLVNGSFTASLGTDGNLTFPAGGNILVDDGKIISADGEDFKIIVQDSDDNGNRLDLVVTDGTDQATRVEVDIDGMQINTNLLDVANQRNWRFKTDGSTEFPDDTISQYNSLKIKSGTSSSTAIWTFGTDGSLTLPIGVSIDNNVDPLYPRIIADSGKAFSVQGQGNDGTAALAWTVNPDAASQYAAVSVSRAGGDNLAKVVLQAQSDSGDEGTVKTWKFDEAGTLTLSAGGTITEGGGFTGAIRLTPAGGANEYQALVIYPTAAVDGDHIHLTAGGGTTDLYLGSDLQYVKIENGGNVVIQSVDSASTTNQWLFDTNGDLTAPRNIILNNPVTTVTTTVTGTVADSNANPFTFRILKSANPQLVIPFADPNFVLKWTAGDAGSLAAAAQAPGGHGVSSLVSDDGTYWNFNSWYGLGGNRPNTGTVFTVEYGLVVNDTMISTTETNLVIEADAKQYRFGTDGSLTLPAGGDILDSTGASVLGGGSASWPVTNTAGASGPTLIALGENAGLTSQGVYAVAVGRGAGQTSQGANSVAIGQNAGATNQDIQSVAVGLDAGQTSQGLSTVAIGQFAGRTSQGNSAVAVGAGAGTTTQGAAAVAVGAGAGLTNQGASAVAIGDDAGYTNQGVNAVAIGKQAGETSQAANSIIINATGAALNQTTASTFTVAPIRNASGTSGVLQYNTATKEVSYSNEITVNSKTWTFGTDGNITLPAGGDIVDSTSATAFVSLATLKQVVADSTDFADFKSRIAGM